MELLEGDDDDDSSTDNEENAVLVGDFNSALVDFPWTNVCWGDVNALENRYGTSPRKRRLVVNERAIMVAVFCGDVCK